MKPLLSVVVPAYNEAQHLEGVISEIVTTLEAAHVDYEVVIVNNGSKDNTPDIIAKLQHDCPRVRHIELAENQQYGGGIQAGLKASRGETIGWIHADGQADPNDLVRLYQEMKQGGYDLAKAVRIVRYESRWRIVQSKIYHLIFQTVFWTPYRDINGTPRLMTRKGYERLGLRSRDWFLEPEFVIKALRYKMPIWELETIWRSRRSGSTRAHFLTGLEFLKNMILYRLHVK